MLLAFLWMWQQAARQATVQTIPYSQFKEAVASGEVTECTVSEDDITGEIRPKKTDAKSAEEKPAAKPGGKNAPQKPPQPQTYAFRTERIEDPGLAADLEKAHVKFTGVRPSFLSQFLWAWAIPIVAILLLWRFIAGRFGGLGQSVLSFGASRARLAADKESSVTFDDVAGCEEAKQELQEVVTFLKYPDRYRALGAKIPKGLLLAGPPGTGKTLLGRAVAGEARVPFFSINGSEFVEMFAGVGAARVRDLFQQAKSNAPCIVFIDELDAVGRQRGLRLSMANDEREQTLNQLLVGLDGFEANLGVVVLAATNRPEVLDRALLRPGRFDRQIVVDAPGREGRTAILKLHARGMPLAKDCDLDKIAQETPGFSGADLANLINEAALLAARRDAREIIQLDLQDAVEKVVAGPERKSRRLNAEDKRRVAYHETGHALVGAYQKYGEALHKISIIPRGRAALGYTLQLPHDDQYLRTREQLQSKIVSLLGGRAAEELIFNEISTGAENDLEQATIIARQMVTYFGMSQAAGLVHWARPGEQFLPWQGEGLGQRDCSEATAREIDLEIRKILDEAYRQAKELLQEHHAQLDVAAQELLVRETMDAQTFHRLIGLAEKQ
jgi:cell division protease FtsH